MSIRAINWAFSQQLNDPSAKLVLIKLADNANDDGECWPSKQHIENHTELSRRTITRKIQELTRLGLIKTIHRWDGDVQLTNRYQLVMGGVMVTPGGTQHDTQIVSEPLVTKSPVRTRARVRPRIVELKEYATSIGFATFDPQNFLDYYDANGWKVGRNTMKDWKATVRTWKHRQQERTTTHATNKRPAGRIDRNVGTANEGRSSQYAGVGKVK